MTDENPASERQLPGALSNAPAVAKSLLGRLLPASYLRPARQSAWIGSFRAARMLGTVAMLAVSARILGPEGFGELAVIIAAVRMAYRLLSMPGDEVITTFVARDLAAGRGISAAGTLRFAFALSQMLALAAYAMVALAAYALSGLLGSAAEHRDAVLLYGLGGIALATMRESLAVLQVSDRLRLGLAVAAVGTLVRVAALIWVWQGGYGLMGVVAAYVAGDAVTGVGLFVVAASSERKAGLPGFLRTLGVRFPGWDVIRFQAASFGRTSLDAATLYIDVLLLAGLVSAAQLGIYRAASQLINATKLPFWSATRAVRAECARLWHTGDIDAVRRICIRFTAAAALLAVAGYAILAAFHEPIIRLALGDGFEDAGRPLLFLLPGALALAAMTSLQGLPAATGSAAPRLLATAAAFGAQVAAIWMLAPGHGATGAAIAQSIFFLVFATVMTPLAIRYLRRGRIRVSS